MLEFVQKDSDKRFGRASADFRFASTVAAFGMLLRESEHRGTATFSSVLDLAEAGRGEDPRGYRTEFIRLAETAELLAR